MIAILISVQVEEEKLKGRKWSGECRTVILQIPQYCK